MTAFRLRMALVAISVAMALAALVISCGAQAATDNRTGDQNGDRSGNQAADDPALEGLPDDFQRLLEVWELLRREHIDGSTLDSRDLSDGAIRGMLQALDDPYASYLRPEQFAVETQDIKGFFEGIGAEVGIRDGQITILAPMPKAPAERAGIRPGDVILEIDGESAEGISLLEAVSRIRGQKGTAVELLILHLNESEPVLISIIRGVIPLTSVRLLMQAGGIGHIRLSSFNGNTNDELEEALDRFKEAGGVGLVLDLRNNPGGLVSSVVNVASQFLDESLVLYQIDAQGRRTDWEVKSGGNALDIPMVVLVNAFSASASEVLSGTLIYHERATVIGTTTFGKGSVNNLWPLEDGSGLYFTIARWFTPSGTQIEGDGIDPDIVQENPEDATEDVQLNKAIEVLRQQLINSG